MCGIFGAVGPIGSGSPLAERDVVRLRDTMSARGPDGAGHLSRGHVVLAHRRLSIRDHAAPNQPWMSGDGSVAVVYNGEIYNDVELRATLGRHGHRFKTHCDTELLPAAYQHWGTSFPEQLRGDFAIALYDFNRHRLLIARDRCGTKPLFYAWIGRSLVFSSTIRAIRRHPEFKTEPDWSAISHYLTTLRLTLDERTVFRGICTLQPGERLLFEQGRVQVNRYWRPPLAEENDDFEAATNAFESRLREAVKIRLSGDVPAGLFLSGGVDSNTIASLVRDETGDGLAAACGEGYDAASPAMSSDAAYASMAARYTGCDLTTVRVRPEEYLDTWLALLDDYETPVSTPTDAILFHVANTMKQSGAGFVLGGEGADELLCGYAAAHYSGHDYDRSQQLQDGRWSPEPNVRRLFRDSLRRGYGRERFHSPVDHYFALNSLIATEAKPLLLTKPVWEAAGRDAPMRQSYQSRLDEGVGCDANAKILRLLYRVNLESLLSRLDSAAMKASLEVRPVFTDHVLVEETFRRPEAFKIDVADQEPARILSSTDLATRGSLRDKRLLRCVASRLMPHKLAYRPKASFPTPIAKWLAHDWRAWASRTMRESPFAAFLMRPEAREGIAADPGPLGMRLWPLLNVVLWGDRQFT